MKNIPLWLSVMIVVGFIGLAFWGHFYEIKKSSRIQSFEECVSFGNPVMESYPEQCITRDGRHFINESQQVACTMDAKICPDGSAVGRTGPNCEFVACPVVFDGSTEKEMISTYIRANIGAISPVDPVLGGTWYVVSLDVNVDNKTVFVVYEDGHIQSEQTFSYLINDNGLVSSVKVLQDF